VCLLRYKYTRAVAAFTLRFGGAAGTNLARLLPCRPAAALTIGMMATWLSTIVAVLVIVAKGLFGSKAKRA
jgi:hypothetical protein